MTVCGSSSIRIRKAGRQEMGAGSKPGGEVVHLAAGHSAGLACAGGMLSSASRFDDLAGRDDVASTRDGGKPPRHDVGSPRLQVAANQHDVGSTRNDVRAARHAMQGSLRNVLASRNTLQGSGSAMQGAGNTMQASGNPLQGGGNAMQGPGNTVQASGTRCKVSKTRCKASGNDVLVSRHNVWIARNAMQGCPERDARSREHDARLPGTRGKSAPARIPMQLESQMSQINADCGAERSRGTRANIFFLKPVLMYSRCILIVSL